MRLFICRTVVDSRFRLTTQSKASHIVSGDIVNLVNEAIETGDDTRYDLDEFPTISIVNIEKSKEKILNKSSVLFVTDIDSVTSGPGFNAAKQRLRLEGKPGEIFLSSRIGDDKAGKKIIKSMEVLQLSTDLILVGKNNSPPTRQAMVFMKDDERYFILVGDTFPKVLSNETKKKLKSCEYLHLDDLSKASVEAIKLLRKYNEKAVITYDLWKYNPNVIDQTRLCSIVSLSTSAAIQLLNHLKKPKLATHLKEVIDNKTPIKDICIQKILDTISQHLVCKLVIITLGSKGCVFLDEKSRYFLQPAFKIKEVCCPVGAGDVFNGAYGYYFHQGCSLLESIAKATACAAIYVETGKFPTSNDIDLRLQNKPKIRLLESQMLDDLKKEEEESYSHKF